MTTDVFLDLFLMPGFISLKRTKYLNLTVKQSFDIKNPLPKIFAHKYPEGKLKRNIFCRILLR